MKDVKLTGRITGLAAALIAVSGLFVAEAGAAADQIKIREVLPGISEYGNGPEYVELQTMADNQSSTGGQIVTFYGPTADVKGTFAIPSDVAQGGSQRSILLATQAVNGAEPDFTLPGRLLEADGGAVCFSNFDCVHWGSYPAANAAPLIPLGKSLHRTIGRGCTTALDPADDSDNSNADFATANPSPRNNSTAPTEQLCSNPDPNAVPNTTITRTPKSKTRKRSAKFAFQSDVRGANFMCKLDKKPFVDCDSPVVYGESRKLKRGKHSFEVYAVAGGQADPTPTRYVWKIIKKKRKK